MYREKMNFCERLLCGAIIFAGGYLFLRYALAWMLPFIVAYLVSLMIYPLSRLISKRAKVSHRLVSALLVIIITAVLCALVYIGMRRLVGEAGEIISGIERGDERLTEPLRNIILRIESIFSRSSFFERIGIGEVGERLGESILEAAYSLISEISLSAASYARRLPELFIALFVALFAAYYFVADKEKMGAFFASVTPKGAKAIFHRLGAALKKYAKAYLLLMLMTFVESLVGLLILGVNYSFIIAFLVTLVDLLPFFGAGTVFIPWAIFAFLVENYHLGTGLIILYGVMTLIRQLSEPRIIGTSIGLHPLASLVSVYLGFRICGVSGMILGPAVALAVKELLCARTEPASII